MVLQLARLGAVGRMAVDDWIADWRFSRARMAFTVIGLWIFWALVCTLFLMSELAVRRGIDEIDRADPFVARWVDARSWDGMSDQVGASERLGPGDACAPTSTLQWRSEGGWHPACASRLSGDRTRIARVDAPESLLVTQTRGELRLMLARREGAGTASLVGSSKVPGLRRLISAVRAELRPLRIAGWGSLLAELWVLFIAVAANERRRDATVALRVTFGQRRLETWWAGCVSMTLWTLVGSGIPLAAAVALDLSNSTQLAVATSIGFGVSLAEIALADARVRRSRSLAMRIAAGAG